MGIPKKVNVVYLLDSEKLIAINSKNGPLINDVVEPPVPQAVSLIFFSLKMTGTEPKNEDSFDDPFKMIRNNFNFTFICEFMHHFSTAFFNLSDDILPTTPVQS